MLFPVTCPVNYVVTSILYLSCYVPRHAIYIHAYSLMELLGASVCHAQWHGGGFYIASCDWSIIVCQFSYNEIW